MQFGSSFVKLTKLYIEKDQAVAMAYSWDDLEPGHSFLETQQGVRSTISEVAKRQVLIRLQETITCAMLKKLQQDNMEIQGNMLLPKNPKIKIKNEQKQEAPPMDQVNFLGMVADSPANPSDAVSGNQVSTWDQCICIFYGKNLAGFIVAEHTQIVQDGKYQGYRVSGKLEYE